MKYTSTKDQMKKADNDVQTPADLAKQIIGYYKDVLYGTILEPCAGDGNFFNQFPNKKTSKAMDIRTGTDFLRAIQEGKVKHFDWIITNPPWNKFKDFLAASFSVADNVIFLVPLNKMLGLKTTIRMIVEHDFNIVNIKCWSTPPKPWPQAGFQIGTIWLQRNGMPANKRAGIENTIIDMNQGD